MENIRKYEIDSRIIEQADLCKQGHSCLNDPEFKLCDIDFVAADGAMLIMFIDQCINCSYKVPFGSGMVCACPIRREILAKYQV